MSITVPPTRTRLRRLAVSSALAASLAAGIAAGDEIEVSLALDTEPRTVTVPPDLAAAIEAAPKSVVANADGSAPSPTCRTCGSSAASPPSADQISPSIASNMDAPSLRAGDYRTRDGWIRLHTNAPHHRRAALAALDCGETRADVEARVRDWSADELESAVVAAGGCAAAMRSADAWRAHAQGRAVGAEPLMALESFATDAPVWRMTQPDRPLAGLRVLDLTRILAGPVATRFLAGYGADVLRIDPPDWDLSLIHISEPTRPY